MRSSHRFALVAGLVAAIAGATGASGETFSYAPLDTVLQRHVHDGRVDYRGLSQDRDPLERFLAVCSGARPDSMSREDQIAFWVNAYNARVLDGVIRRPGLRSVLDVGKHWGVPTVAFFREKRLTAGKKLLLSDIEHRILRTRYQEPGLPVRFLDYDWSLNGDG